MSIARCFRLLPFAENEFFFARKFPKETRKTVRMRRGNGRI